MLENKFKVVSFDSEWMNEFLQYLIITVTYKPGVNLKN